MTSFKDTNGNTWELRLSTGMLEKVKEEADFDLDDLMGKTEDAITLIFRDRRKMTMILWAMLDEQAAARGIDPKAFGFLCDGETLDRGADALYEEGMNFYPRSSAGKAIRGRLPEMRAHMDRRLEKQVNDYLDRELSRTATDSPASSGSTPAG